MIYNPQKFNKQCQKEHVHIFNLVLFFLRRVHLTHFLRIRNYGKSCQLYLIPSSLDVTKTLGMFHSLLAKNDYGRILEEKLRSMSQEQFDSLKLERK